MSTPQVTHIEAALSDDQIKTILDVMPRIKSNKGGLTGGDVLQGVVAAWDLGTQAMFSAVIAFWFGNRMMKSAKK